MMPVIQDGYTFTAPLEPIGPWDRITVRYRPALPEDILEFNYQRELNRGRAQMPVIVGFLKQHLAGWDCTVNGSVLPFNDENLKRLAIPYQVQLIEHILGYGKIQAGIDAKNSAGASG